MENVLIGYARVSKNDGSQVLDLQKDALKNFGVLDAHIYEDLASGKNDDRPGLTACLKALRKGDTLIVWKLDRLGRSLKHLVDVIEDLKKRKIGFKVLTGQGAQIDTSTPNGRMVFGMFAVLAEFERELISERTKAGLVSARARGRLGGRPKKMDETTIKMASAAMQDPKTKPSELAKKLGISVATLYTYVNGDGSLKEIR